LYLQIQIQLFAAAVSYSSISGIIIVGQPAGEGIGGKPYVVETISVDILIQLSIIKSI
jgi:hypothetical protein